MNSRWILVPLAVGGLAATAHADGYSLHVLGNVQASWTDNLFSQEDGPQRVSDFYYQLRPGAMLSYETPRTIHQLTAELDALLYQQHDSSYNVQYMAGWRGFYLVSPRSEGGASVLFSQGQLSALTMQGAASDGVIDDATAAGESEATYMSLDGAQNYSFTPTREIRLTQGARARRFATETDAGDRSTGIEAGLSGGIDRGWKYSAVALQLAGSFVRMDRTDDTEPATDQVHSSSLVSWRRDFGPRWTSLVDAGVTALIPLTEENELVIQPTVGGQVSYAPNWGTAGLQVRRSVAPNLYLARNTITDSVVANAWLPLPWLTDDPLLPRLTLQGTAGLQRSQLIDTMSGTVQSGFDLLSGDLAVNYVPRNGLVVTLRAQHLRQIEDEDGVMEDVVHSYDRTTIMVTLTGRFPDRLAAEMPLRSSLRVDRSNTTPVGDEAAPAATDSR